MNKIYMYIIQISPKLHLSTSMIHNTNSWIFMLIWILFQISPSCKSEIVINENGGQLLNNAADQPEYYTIRENNIGSILSTHNLVADKETSFKGGITNLSRTQVRVSDIERSEENVEMGISSTAKYKSQDQMNYGSNYYYNNYLTSADKEHLNAITSSSISDLNGSAKILPGFLTGYSSTTRPTPGYSLAQTYSNLTLVAQKEQRIGSDENNNNTVFEGLRSKSRYRKDVASEITKSNQSQHLNQSQKFNQNQRTNIDFSNNNKSDNKSEHAHENTEYNPEFNFFPLSDHPAAHPSYPDTFNFWRTGTAQSIEGPRGQIGAVIPGQMILGGLFPVHKKGSLEDSGTGDGMCGEIQPDRGIQRLEAMLFTIDHVNNNTAVLPDIKLGASIYDTCARKTYALDQTLDYIKASLSVHDPAHFQCEDQTAPSLRQAPVSVVGVVGGSYSSVSLHVANLLRLFKIPQVSYASTSAALSDKSRFSYFARTVPSDNYQAKAMADIAVHFNWTYVNTIHSEGDYGQAGIDAFRQEARARNICIGVSEKIPTTVTPTVLDTIIERLMTKPTARLVVLFLRVEDARDLMVAVSRSNHTNATHFVWLASDGWGKEEIPVKGNQKVAEGALTIELQSTAIKEFDEYFTRLSPLTNNRNPWFREYWEHVHNCRFNIDDDDVNYDDEIDEDEGADNNNEDSESVKEGAETGVKENLTEKSKTASENSNKDGKVVDLPNFPFQRHSIKKKRRHHFESDSHHYTNPGAFIETGEFKRHKKSSGKRRRKCTGLEVLAPGKYTQESKIQFVFDAVYALAHALHNLIEDSCGKGASSEGAGGGPGGSGAQGGAGGRKSGRGKSGRKFKSKEDERKACIGSLRIDGSVLYKKYLLNVSFDDGYGGDVRFDRYGDGVGRYNIMNYRLIGSTRRYGYETIGRWFDGVLEMDRGHVSWPGGTDQVPVSVCSRPCEVGEIKRIQPGDVCCWVCTPCDSSSIVEDEHTCSKCPSGGWPSPDKKQCLPLPVQYLHWMSPYAIVPLTLSTLGVIFTCLVTGVFIKNIETPVVKASGRELSFMLFGGFLLCYSMTFVILVKPSPVTCAILRFGVGFSFSITYSALLVKTNRISRIFESAKRSARRPLFISPRSQVVFTIVLILVQAVGGALWLLVEPPDVRTYHPFGRRNEIVLRCQFTDILFMASLGYDMILIIVCTVYAIKTRQIPENFNESKHIGFTMYTTCVIWLAFVPIYFGTYNSFQVQISTLCISISLSATVALCCLFLPKLHIIIFHADKNTIAPRKFTINSTTVAGYKKSISSGVSADYSRTPHPTAPQEDPRSGAQCALREKCGVGSPREAEEVLLSPTDTLSGPLDMTSEFLDVGMKKDVTINSMVDLNEEESSNIVASSQEYLSTCSESTTEEMKTCKRSAARINKSINKSINQSDMDRSVSYGRGSAPSQAMVSIYGAGNTAENEQEPRVIFYAQAKDQDELESEYLMSESKWNNSNQEGPTSVTRGVNLMNNVPEDEYDSDGNVFLSDTEVQDDAGSPTNIWLPRDSDEYIEDTKNSNQIVEVELSPQKPREGNPTIRNSLKSSDQNPRFSERKSDKNIENEYSITNRGFDHGNRIYNDIENKSYEPKTEQETTFSSEISSSNTKPSQYFGKPNRGLEAKPEINENLGARTKNFKYLSPNTNTDYNSANKHPEVGYTENIEGNYNRYHQMGSPYHRDNSRTGDVRTRPMAQSYHVVDVHNNQQYNDTYQGVNTKDQQQADNSTYHDPSYLKQDTTDVTNEASNLENETITYV